MNHLSQKLLDWFSLYGRELPWRVKGGAHFDAYAVWISEIMLQQTTVKTVLEYFPRWMKRFPNIQTLADSDIQDVLLMWQGLGYYTRAKKIHECARILKEKYNGKIPNNRDILLKLPGIGPYTASSICCFAFNLPETVVDGNVIRVIARLYGLTHAVTKEEIYQLAQPLTPSNYGADYASAIMDLGATVCTPDKPNCSVCPWKKNCIAYQKKLTDTIPLIQKPIKKERYGNLFLVQNGKGEFLIQKREGKGLLSGLYEFPWNYQEEDNLYSVQASNKLGTITHTFTHFKLFLTVYLIMNENVPEKKGVFVSKNKFKEYPFSTLMRKVFRFI